LLIKDAFKFFLREEVTLLFEQKTIVVGDLKEVLPKIKNVSELRTINEENFFAF